MSSAVNAIISINTLEFAQLNSQPSCQLNLTQQETTDAGVCVHLYARIYMYFLTT